MTHIHSSMALQLSKIRKLISLINMTTGLD